MKWYFKALFQYFDFEGRARRKEFWVFALSNMLLLLILNYLDSITTHSYFYYASYVFSAFIFIPSVTVFLRRLHDVGKTGWNIFLIFIPFIGWLWLLILLLFVGEPRHNKWGAYPKGVDNIHI